MIEQLRRFDAAASYTSAGIGRAAASRKSVLVHGPSGNGKTTAVQAIGEAIGGTVYIPYAIEVAGRSSTCTIPRSTNPRTTAPPTRLAPPTAVRTAAGSACAAPLSGLAAS